MDWIILIVVILGFWTVWDLVNARYHQIMNQLVGMQNGTYSRIDDLKRGQNPK